MIFYKVVSADFTDIHSIINYREITKDFTITFPTYATIYLFEAIEWCHLFSYNEKYIRITTSDCLKTRLYDNKVQLLPPTIILEVKILSEDDILAVLKEEQYNPNINWAGIFQSNIVRPLIVNNLHEFSHSQRHNVLKKQLEYFL
jgi:hypothetical protein